MLPNFQFEHSKLCGSQLKVEKMLLLIMSELSI